MEAELSQRKNSDRSPDPTEAESPKEGKQASIVLSTEEIKMMKCLKKSKSGVQFLSH